LRPRAGPRNFTIVKKPRGNRRCITPTVYGAIVDAFRTLGPPPASSWAALAHKAGVDTRTVKRAWEFGWPNKSFAATPLRREYEVANVKAQAEIMREQGRVENERDVEAAKHGAKARLGEAVKKNEQMVDVGRLATLHIGAAVAQLGLPSVELSKRLGQEMRKLAVDPQFDPMLAIRMLEKGASMAERIVRAGQAVLESSNLLNGLPTEIFGLQGGLPEELTVAEAQKRAEAALQAIQSAKRGHLRVIDGGGQDAAWAGQEA